MPRSLTPRQADVLDFIKGFHEAFGFMPTYREIAEHFRFTHRAAYDYIAAIVKKGYLKREPTRPRCIQFVPELKMAMRDAPEGVFQKGDYVHVYGNVVTAITRAFTESCVADLQ